MPLFVESMNSRWQIITYCTTKRYSCFKYEELYWTVAQTEDGLQVGLPTWVQRYE